MYSSSSLNISVNLLIVNSVYVPGIQEVFARRKSAKFQLRFTKQYPLSDIFFDRFKWVKCGLSCQSHGTDQWKNNSKNIFCTENCLAINIQKWSILTFFFAMTVTWPSSLYPSGGFLGMCSNARFDRGHLSSWLDKLTWHTVPCQVIWGGTAGECEHSTWQTQLDNLTCQVPLYSNASVGPWLFERATSFYQGTWEGSRREIESPKLPFTLDLIPQAYFLECTIPFLSLPLPFNHWTQCKVGTRATTHELLPKTLK